jgi:hypothetical protein
MYPHTEFQALTRNTVEQKGSTNHTEEWLVFPPMFPRFSWFPELCICGNFVHGVVRNVGSE